MTDEPVPRDGLIQALRIQAAVCDRMGSPFCGALLSSARDDVVANGPTARLMSRWADIPARAAVTDAVALRLLGALHDLAISGKDQALTAAYPAADRAGDPEAAWRASLAAMDGNAARLSRFLDHEPQTNEVRRSACLLPGFLVAAAETRLPIRALEIGASAGLNQLWDRFYYTLGKAGSWGPSDSPVAVPTEWGGDPPPLDAPITVIERVACDRKPVDLNDPAARQRLRAYIWADQRDRLARLDAAIDLALEARTVVHRQDAVDWTRAIDVRDGAATVLYHSVFWQYMPPESQAALTSVIENIGDRANATSPFAWLRMEPPPSDNLTTMELRLTMWPGGETRRLATVHPHGAWVEWLGA